MDSFFNLLSSKIRCHGKNMVIFSFGQRRTAPIEATATSNLSLSFLIRISYFWKISSMPISSLLFLRLLSNIKCWNISALHILKQLQFTLT